MVSRYSLHQSCRYVNTGSNNPQNLTIPKEMDGDLEALSRQILPHLESLRGNISQLDGIGEALVRTRAIVDNVLYEKVEPHAYAHIVSGS